MIKSKYQLKLKEKCVSKVKELIAERYMIEVADMEGKSRKAKFCTPRFIAMKLIRDILNLNLVSIGFYFGGRNYTTVISAINTIEGHLETEKKLEKEYLIIKAKATEAIHLIKYECDSSDGCYETRM